jgi:hypothetical protein
MLKCYLLLALAVAGAVQAALITVAQAEAQAVLYINRQFQ